MNGEMVVLSIFSVCVNLICMKNFRLGFFFYLKDSSLWFGIPVFHFLEIVAIGFSIE